MFLYVHLVARKPLVGVRVVVNSPTFHNPMHQGQMFTSSFDEPNILVMENLPLLSCLENLPDAELSGGLLRGLLISTNYLHEHSWITLLLHKLRREIWMCILEAFPLTFLTYK